MTQIPAHVLVAVVLLLLACAGLAVLNWRGRRAAAALRQQLQETERWMAGVRLSYEAARVAVWEWDIDQDRLRGDEQLFRLLDIAQPGNRIRLSDCLVKVHPQDKEELLHEFEQACSTHDRIESEFRVVRDDGSKRALYLRGACVVDSSSRRQVMVGAMWDITERRSDERHLAATYATSPLAILVATRDSGKIVEVNDAAVAMSGRSRETLLELSVMDLGLWNDPAEPFQRFAQGLRHGRVRHRISSFIRGDGEERRAQVSATLTDRDGVLHVLHVIEDVTEQRRQHEALLESQERFARIFDISPDPILIVDSAGRISDANPAFLLFSRYEEEELWGRTTTELRLWGDAEVESRFVSQLQAPGEVKNVESLIGRKDGEPAHCQVSWSGFALGDKHYVLLIMHDITELKERNAQIAQLNTSLERMVQSRTAQLESANRELESFTYSVSHDLRAPLRHISGFASLLNERKSVREDPEAVRLIGVVVRAAVRLGTLIDDLLSFSRVSRQQMTLRPVQLTELVQDVVEEFRAAERERTVQWRIGKLPVVQGDRELLRSVVLNLFDNALKYTQPRSVAVIEVGGETHDDEAHVFVRDNGVGFDMDYAENLFGVFQRLHTSEEFEGTGVGLASVQRIIERHGGRVWAEGVPDEGATFWFSLPLPSKTAQDDELTKMDYAAAPATRMPDRGAPGAVSRQP